MNNAQFQKMIKIPKENYLGLENASNLSHLKQCKIYHYFKTLLQVIKTTKIRIGRLFQRKFL
jgi:hypothetical protein